MISYILYRFAAFLIRIVPSRLAPILAAAIAACFFAARPAIRRNVARNHERIGLAGRPTWPVFKNFSRAVADFLALSPDRPDDLAARCAIAGEEYLSRALAAGKGAILFGPHLGPWELGGARLAALGRRIHTTALEHPSSRVTRYFSARRAAWGIVDRPSHMCAADFIRALAGNEPVALLVDRDFSNRGIRAIFFGEETLMPGGHVVLALRSGAPLLPCCSYYAEDGRIVGVIGPPVERREGREAVETLVAACLERLEALIRAHPDQWFAFDHVWRKRDA